MEAIAALVPRGGNDKSAMGNAVLNGTGKKWMGRTGWGEFTAADVDNVSTFLNGLVDGSGEIELGTGSK